MLKGMLLIKYEISPEVHQILCLIISALTTLKVLYDGKSMSTPSFPLTHFQLINFNPKRPSLFLLRLARDGSTRTPGFSSISN